MFYLALHIGCRYGLNPSSALPRAALVSVNSLGLMRAA